MPRATRAVERAGLEAGLLDEKLSVPSGRVSVGAMHLAKGLEFGRVAVMACDDEVIPLQERIEAIGDQADLQESTTPSATCSTWPGTRARDHPAR